MNSGRTSTSVGIDCESTARWRELLVSRPEQIGHLFCPDERAYCSQLGDPAEAYAGFWCAKEAVCKALGGVDVLLPRDVVIKHDKHGRPLAVLPSHMRMDCCVDVSISHCEVCVVAVALVKCRSHDQPK